MRRINYKFWLAILITVTLGAIGWAQNPSGAYNSPALGGSPGGANTQVQYNNNGAFGGTSKFTVNGTGNFQTAANAAIGDIAGGQALTFTGADITINSYGGSFVTTLNGFKALSYSTVTNCASSASPAVCGSAAAGSFVLAAAATTVTVNTTAVTANSEIIVINDDSLGTRLSVTCNTALDQVFVSARVAATSFTITGTAPVTNPNCYSYFIVN